MFGFFNNRKSLSESGILKGAVDNHSHILYGVDDGVRTLDESLAILKFLEKAGLSKLWLTPHIMEDVPNTTSDLKERFSDLQSAYGGSINLSLASEYMMDNLFMKRLSERDLLLHGDDTVLVETSTWAPPIDFWDIMEKIMNMGYRPILAHPERYRYMKESDYQKLHDMQVLLQLNIPSIVGVYGEQVQMKARDLMEKGWYSMTGSDCHRFKAIQGQYESRILKSETLNRLDTLLHCAV
ncbi:MAG: capsular biosynthesis protein [Bacteroidales bacterium]|jgi:tyrosine-protein phosphatase YwqE|nr:capsular biosynthesis protein [Bacteroidales bacterium]MCI1784997.1 capsular biosynthesis protein [Bacteroidales bacterium]